MKLSRELAQASRNHEVLWIMSMRSQAVSFKKSRGFPCLNKICDNQNIFDIKKSV